MKEHTEKLGVVCNVANWKAGAVDTAVKLANEMNVEVATGREMIGVNEQPVIRLHKDGGLSEFWNRLKEEVPNYWENS